MINVKKDSHNFYVGVSKPRLSVLGCLLQYNLNETSDCVVFIFFKILRFEIGGVAYLWMQLIHGRLRYYPRIQLVRVVWREKQKMKIYQVFMSSTTPKNMSFHIVKRTRTAEKCAKIKNACAKIIYLLHCS